MLNLTRALLRLVDQSLHELQKEDDDVLDLVMLDVCALEQEFCVELVGFYFAEFYEIL